MMDYVAIKVVHQSAVALSLTGFFVRGVASLSGAQWVNCRLAKTLPHVIDSVLLLSGLTLAWMLQATPVNAPWLVAKIIGLVAYVGLGVVALCPGYSAAIRVAAWVGALVSAAWIVSVAMTKNPFGFLGRWAPI